MSMGRAEAAGAEFPSPGSPPPTRLGVQTWHCEIMKYAPYSPGFRHPQVCFRGHGFTAAEAIGQAVGQMRSYGQKAG